jgi:hypothetical protein
LICSSDAIGLIAQGIDTDGEGAISSSHSRFSNAFHGLQATPVSSRKQRLSVSGCQPVISSSLPGARLEFTTTNWTYTLEQVQSGITIGYQVVIDTDISGVLPIPTDSGQCEQPGPSGLIVSETISGNGQLYCRCDTGLCPQYAATATRLKRGIYAQHFTWDGRNWTGPSDVDTPKGPLFPPGTYTVTLAAKGTRQLPDRTLQPFEMVSSCELQLIP